MGMALPMMAAAQKQQGSKSITLPFPVGGLNARDPLDAMSELDAIELRNVIPRGSYGELRKGSVYHIDPAVDAIAQDKVQTLAEWVGADNSRVLIAARNDFGTSHDFFIVTSSGNWPGSPAKSGLTNSYWQHVQFGGYLVLVNGLDQPQKFNGTAFSDAVYTGIADDSVLRAVCVFKSRLYFAQGNSTKVWYGAVDAVQGALTEFDVGGQLQRGGSIFWVSSSSHDSGAGSMNYFVIGSSAGEVLVYAGNNPTDFALVGRYFVGAPLSIRSQKHVGGALMMLTDEGVIPLPDVMSGRYKSGKYPTLTDKIQNKFREFVQTVGAAAGWELFHYPRGNLLIVNVPTDDLGLSGSMAQLVMNTETGAWCVFSEIDAYTWCLFNERPFYGSSAGGYVGEWDTGYANITSLDGREYYSARIQFPFHYLKDRGNNKLVHMIRPLLYGDPETDFEFNLLTDFQPTPTNAPAITSSGSDDAEYIDNWEGASGYGRAFSIFFYGYFENSPFQMNAVQVLYETADIF